MSEQQSLPISVQPVVSYPQEAEVGKTYLITVDLRLVEGSAWTFEEEEYPIYCLLDSEPLFHSEPVGEPAIVLHRFGGSYGAAKFTATASLVEAVGSIQVKLINGWGVPVKVLTLDNIEVVREVSQNPNPKIVAFRSSQASQALSEPPRQEDPKFSTAQQEKIRGFLESGQALNSAKQYVYFYIHGLAQLGLSDVDGASKQACRAFQALLWDRVAVDRRDVIQALDTVIASKEFDSEQGLRFINRCYYTICNPWHNKFDSDRIAALEWIIRRLLELPAPIGHARLTVALRRRLYDFKQSDYALCLLRQLRLGGYKGYSNAKRQNRGIIGDVLSDYFFLYRSTTRTPDIEELEQRDFNDDARQGGIGSKQLFKLEETYQSLSKYSKTRFNPTALRNAEFQQVWQHYHPARKDGFSARAIQFQNSIRSEMSLQASQPLIHKYLLQPIQEVQEINTRMRLQYDIQSIWDSFELDIPTLRSIVILSFERALNALFLPSFNKQNVQKFKALVLSIGSMNITNILLTLVLGCPFLRFSLEKRLGYLYSSFEDAAIEEEAWLVNFFEYMNVALVMNAKQLIYL